MGEEIAQFTSCDAIAEVGGCVNPEFKVKCCASCASASGVPMRMTYKRTIGWPNFSDNWPARSSTSVKPHIKLEIHFTSISHVARCKMLIEPHGSSGSRRGDERPRLRPRLGAGRPLRVRRACVVARRRRAVARTRQLEGGADGGDVGEHLVDVLAAHRVAVGGDEAEEVGQRLAADVDRLEADEGAAAALQCRRRSAATRSRRLRRAVRRGRYKIRRQ